MGWRLPLKFDKVWTFGDTWVRWGWKSSFRQPKCLGGVEFEIHVLCSASHIHNVLHITEHVSIHIHVSQAPDLLRYNGCSLIRFCDLLDFMTVWSLSRGNRRIRYPLDFVEYRMSLMQDQRPCGTYNKSLKKRTWRTLIFPFREKRHISKPTGVHNTNQIPL